MPQSVQTIETILQESDGVALLTNKKMEPEDLMLVSIEGAGIKVNGDVVGHLKDAIKMYRSNWKGPPKYKKCMILENIFRLVANLPRKARWPSLKSPLFRTLKSGIHITF